MQNSRSIKLYSWPFVALLLALVIVCLGFLGIVARTDRDLLFRLFDLDFEHNFPTAFSGLLLFANAWLVFHLKRLGMLGGWGLGLSLVFLFMGCDEILRIHERSERLLNIDYQITFSPLVILAFGGWVHVLRKVWRDHLALAFWLLGAAAWGSSQVLEAAEWNWSFWTGVDTQVEGYVVMMIVEELLEMSGSTFFLLALLKYLQSSTAEEASELSPANTATSG